MTVRRSVSGLALALALVVVAVAAPALAKKRPAARGGGGGGGKAPPGPLKVVRRFKGHENAITTLCFMKNGTTLVSGSLDSTIRMWDTGKDKGNPIKSIPAGEGVIIHQLACHPAREQFAAATSEGVVLYNGDGKEVQKFALPKGGAEGVAYGPEGDSVVGVALDGPQTWTSEDGAKLKANPKLRNGKAVAFRPTGSALIAVGGEGWIKLWSPSDNKVIDVEIGGEMVSMAFSPDGEKLAAFSTDRTVRSIDVSDPTKASQSWEHPDVANDTRVVWSANGKAVISGGDGEVIKAFDSGSGADAWEQHAPSPNTRVVATSPNGKLLATAGENEILVWTAK